MQSVLVKRVLRETVPVYPDAIVELAVVGVTATGSPQLAMETSRGWEVILS